MTLAEDDIHITTQKDALAFAESFIPEVPIDYDIDEWDIQHECGPEIPLDRIFV